GFAALALTVVVSVNRADDKAKTDAPPGAAKSPAQQFADLEKAFDTEIQKLKREYGSAKAEDKAKIREQAFKLAPDYAKKFLGLADASPKDPIAAKALMWIATVSDMHHVPPPPEAKDAFDRLIRD